MTSDSTSKSCGLILVNARPLLRMVCVKEDQSKEGANAFKDESYHNEHGCTRPGVEIVGGCETGKGPWVVMHVLGRFECCAPGCVADGVRLCCRARYGRCAQRPSRLHGADRWHAQDAACARKAIELGVDHAPAPPAAAAFSSGSHRLSPRSLLRNAAQEPQRDLLRATQSWHEALSRLCICLRCRIRSALHRGPDLGPTP